ncbi:MAG: signal peptidase I [Clostridiales bacterium]|nr:signal peptidase I [Clostridiales bacterium]
MRKTNPDNPEASKWELTPTPVERMAPASEKAEREEKKRKAEAVEEISKEVEDETPAEAPAAADDQVTDEIIFPGSESSKEEDADKTGSDSAKLSEEELKAEKRKKIRHEALDWLKTILIGVTVGVLLVVFVIQRDNVYGPSMQPTLYDGYVVFTEKISTYFDKYDRGDVVILDGHGMIGYDKDEYLIKRIIGLPGDTIRIADGNVYLKKKGDTEFYLLEESYLAEGTRTTVMAYGMEMGYDEITLGSDEYYCMGDNRPVSNDSRNLGPFDEDRIKGVAILIVYPFNAFGLL